MKWNPFRKNLGDRKRITPEREPLEETGTRGRFPGGWNGDFVGRG
jgi:hypothetical protein